MLKHITKRVYSNRKHLYEFKMLSRSELQIGDIVRSRSPMMFHYEIVKSEKRNYPIRGYEADWNVWTTHKVNMRTFQPLKNPHAKDKIEIIQGGEDDKYFVYRPIKNN